MKGPKRSVTPEPFSAGIAPKVISGYLAFQSSANADEANASEAMPAIRSLRFIMMHPSGLGGGNENVGHREFQAAATLPRAGMAAGASAAAALMTSLASRS